MPFREENHLRYFTFSSFPEKVCHGVFTRHGGVSPAPWNTLNLGGTVGDAHENVIENRARLFNVINRPVESIFDVWQVHGSRVMTTSRPRMKSEEHPKADGILTNAPNVTLLMRFADCVPIFLYDPIKGVVGLVHAGWQGTVAKIVVSAVQVMIDEYDSKPEDILAGIGPSIGPDHYEVGEDVITRVKESFSECADRFLDRRNGLTYFDLWGANYHLLEIAGVKKIEAAAICTACHPQDWYSHRRENGKTGRFGAIIALDQGNRLID